MSTPPKPLRVRAGDGFVLRTPLLPMTALVAWAGAGDAGAARRYLAELIARPEIREAIYVASPSLHAAIDGWLAAPASAAGQRVETSLAKYAARMMGRATPFGLFSGVSVGKLGRTTQLELAPLREYRRRTRLDNDYLFVLITALGALPEVRAKLTYRPNTSAYRSAGRLRYAHAQLVDEERSYHLVSVEPTPYLDATLERAARGATREALTSALVDATITLEEACAYIDELIDAQLLVPELGIHITGPEPIDGVLAQLRAAGLDEPARILDDARARVAAIDAGGVGNSVSRYHEIAEVLAQLPAKVDPSRLFQVDMVKPVAGTLSTRIAAELADVIDKLRRIRSARGACEEFKRAFRERWEDRVVPLAEALDEESGIGFEAPRGPGAEGSPLLAGLPFAGEPSENRVTWTAFEHHMLQRLAAAQATGADEIVLADSDLDAMRLERPAELPDAFHVMCRLAATADELARGEPTILLEGIGGPSGARLLGRFCHASEDVHAVVRAHHAVEEALRPNAVFAEVVHLNEGRIGNILCRPVLRDHEIVYLGVSGAPEANQLTIEDLLVSIRGERIVLTSRRLGKEVVPRLTTAHNFRLRSLGVYRFLCALANHDCDSVMWSWGALGGAPVLPRVRIGRTIVARAQWNLYKPDLEPITAAVRAAAKGSKRAGQARSPAETGIAAAVAAVRTACKLPRWFAIAVADNELPIDLDNPLLVAAFADEVSGMDRVQLVELVPTPDRLIATGPEGAFAHELVLTFTRQRDDRPVAVVPRSAEPAIRREFSPGSEWLYAKIYCGESTGDRVIREVVAPVARAALAAGDASQWFFIRYRDPEPHIRLRLRGDPARLCANVLPALERAVAPLGEAGAVRKLMLDAYVRELERYGGARGIELVEELFWRDSEAVAAIVELLDGDAGAIARWKLCVRGIDSLLDTLGLSPEERARVCTEGREMIGRELRADTRLWTKVGEKFTRDRADLEVMFDRDPARDAAHDFEPGFEILRTRDAAIADLAAELRRRDAAGELAPGLRQMAWSLVHMHANRLLHASQRAQELVLYDFIRRLHAARAARSRTAE